MAKTATDPHLDYWVDAVECSLDAIGIPFLLTREQIQTLASDLQVAAEMESMAFGHDAIPNPLTTELSETKRRNKEEALRLEDDWRKREKELLDLCRQRWSRIQDLQDALAEARA